MRGVRIGFSVNLHAAIARGRLINGAAYVYQFLGCTIEVNTSNALLTTEVNSG